MNLKLKYASPWMIFVRIFYCSHLAGEGEEVEDEEPKEVEVDALQRRLEELEREVRANSRSSSCIRTS
jgi:hypothetical protein